MRGADLVKVLCDGWIDTDKGGYVCLHDGMSVPDYFGTGGNPINGYLIHNAEYFYLYFPAEREVEVYKHVGELPNAYIERKQCGDIVALWRIE